MRHMSRHGRLYSGLMNSGFMPDFSISNVPSNRNLPDKLDRVDVFPDPIREFLRLEITQSVALTALY